jgi:hypothetical protein
MMERRAMRRDAAMRMQVMKGFQTLGHGVEAGEAQQRTERFFRTSGMAR